MPVIGDGGLTDGWMDDGGMWIWINTSFILSNYVQKRLAFSCIHFSILLDVFYYQCCSNRLEDIMFILKFFCTRPAPWSATIYMKAERLPCPSFHPCIGMQVLFPLLKGYTFQKITKSFC